MKTLDGDPDNFHIEWRQWKMIKIPHVLSFAIKKSPTIDERTNRIRLTLNVAARKHQAFEYTRQTVAESATEDFLCAPHCFPPQENLYMNVKEL